LVLRLLKLIGRKLSGKASSKKDSTSAKTKETDKKKSLGNKKELEKKTGYGDQVRDGVSPNYKGSNPRLPAVKYSSGKYKQKDTPQSNKPENKTSHPSKANQPVKQNQSEKSLQTDKPHHNRQPQSPKTVQAPKDLKPLIPWNPKEFIVPEVEGKKRFHDFDLPQEIMHAIFDLNFQYCTPIQMEILAKALEGKDAIGQAQTGTGKTAAFLITSMTRIIRHKVTEEPNPGSPRVLVLAPTRELAMQISKDAQLLSKHMNINIVTVFGGMDYNKQRNKLLKPIDILIGTPGRIIDFLNKKELHFNKVDTLILDEADRMLDMGFIPDVKKIIRACPPKENRQTLFFSATINTDVRNLAASWTTDSLSVTVEPEEMIVKGIEQIVYIVTSREKYSLLYNILMKEKAGKVLVFVNRRDETRDLGRKLYRNGIDCEILSGEVDQRKRIKVLDNFKSDSCKVLIATDVAGRGIHVDNISHVINYSLPGDPEDYIHRIGRTARAGATGISISFATEDDSFVIPAIEDLIGAALPSTYPPDELLIKSPPYEREAKKTEASQNQYSHSRRRYPDNNRK